jgi:hypothetical protein
MYIGEFLKERMELFNYSIESLSEKSLVKADLINSLVNNELHIEQIRKFDLELLSSALFCEPLYFLDKAVRDNDLVYSSLNRGTDTSKSNLVKAKLQSFINDVLYINELISE